MINSMKKSYTDYLNELSGNRMDILEELISEKFLEFKGFYRIVSEHSSDIAHVSYRFHEDDTDSLDVDITVNPSVDVSEFIEIIKTDLNDNYRINMDHDGKVIYCSIELRYD